MNPPIRILLVDDDEVDRRICRRALARSEPPAAFVEAETAEQALQRIAEQEFDCILLDFRLPDMDGLDLLERLCKARGEDRRVPVVMLTGADDVTLAVEAMRCGASDYVVKDVDGRYQALMPTVVQRALRERDLQHARWRDEQALARYRSDLSELTRRLMFHEKAMTRRLAQMLHDQLGQTLAAIRLGFDAVEAGRAGASPAQTDRQARRVDALIDRAVREVRLVLVELRPPLLDEHGLVAALDNELRSHPLAGDDVDLRLESKGACTQIRWPGDVEYAAFMIAREAIANALRHARAKSVRVSVDGDAHALALCVIDDGDGIATDTPQPGHLGIVGMRERALAIGGQFTLQSAPAHGTSVRLDWGEAS